MDNGELKRRREACSTTAARVAAPRGGRPERRRAQYSIVIGRPASCSARWTSAGVPARSHPGADLPAPGRAVRGERARPRGGAWRWSRRRTPTTTRSRATRPTSTSSRRSKRPRPPAACTRRSPSSSIRCSAPGATFVSSSARTIRGRWAAVTSRRPPPHPDPGHGTVPVLRAVRRGVQAGIADVRELAEGAS